MKKYLLALLVLVALFPLSAEGGFSLKSQVVQITDSFFAAAQEGNWEEATSHLSEDFKASTETSELEDYLSKEGFLDFKEGQWPSRSASGGQKALSGSITTHSGRVIPLTINFIKEGNDWKIYSLEKPSSGLTETTDETQSHPLPSGAEQMELVREAMHQFALAVNDQSMAQFHSYISHVWQQQFTIEDLDNSYGSLYNIGLDLTVIDNMEPLITTVPTITEEGVLVLTGHFPSQPNKVYFTQKFFYEGIGWKLLGFNISIK
ncbi:MAG: hypothetical protein PQJ59_15455 [Spirochaetales bacterium]|nr:hypothetical protein [Spirochaetales bacterium]